MTFFISTPFASKTLPLTIIHSMMRAATAAVIAAAADVPLSAIYIPLRFAPVISTAGATRSGFIPPSASKPLPDSKSIASFREL